MGISRCAHNLRNVKKLNTEIICQKYILTFMYGTDTSGRGGACRSTRNDSIAARESSLVQSVTWPRCHRTVCHFIPGFMTRIYHSEIVIHGVSILTSRSQTGGSGKYRGESFNRETIRHRQLSSEMTLERREVCRGFLGILRNGCAQTHVEGLSAGPGIQPPLTVYTYVPITNGLSVYCLYRTG